MNLVLRMRMSFFMVLYATKNDINIKRTIENIVKIGKIFLSTFNSVLRIKGKAF